MESKTYTINKKVSKGSKSVLVTLSGELSIQNIVDIKDSLIALLKDYDSMEIVTKKVESFDIACVQIFYALSRSASHLNKKVTYQIDLPEEIQSVIAHSGLQNLLVPKAELH
jgi:ABC-type transporter Mla MlaB component